MKLIKPSVEFIWMTPEPLNTIESAGRTCYKSEKNITKESSEKFIRALIKRGHEAMIEHASISYRVICDRGVTHEIVRHRLFSFAQESTRYVNYKLRGIEFVIPCFWNLHEDEEGGKYETWLGHMGDSEDKYNNLISLGATPQEARSILPNSLKTEIVITGNLREWRCFFKLRTAKDAHPQMREVANLLLDDVRKHIPIVFEDIK